ncbi:hypothetical protein ACWOBE_03505 [Hutsoniella sourekii]
MKIILVCNAGVSTTFLAQKMKGKIEEENLSISLEVVPYSLIDDYFKTCNADLILVTPHLKLFYNSLLKKYKDLSRVEMIDYNDFTNLDGDQILKKSLDLLHG